MRSLSSSPHLGHTCTPHHEDVLIDDAVLPAARHLTGEDAVDALATVVAAAGGQLGSARASHVQYRPGSELVVRYETSVSWDGAPPVHETLLAATTSFGPLAGTVPLVAETETGPLNVSVWRWPFDPVLPGLTAAVTPTVLAPILDVDPARLRLEVVAYRPTERAVVRASTVDEHGRPATTRYVKVLRPAAVSALRIRHERLLDAGVPVPTVTTTDEDDGLLVMDELRGETLRERLKADRGPWPDAERFDQLIRSLAGADLGQQAPVRSRIADAVGHARMLGEIAPEQRGVLQQLTAAFEGALGRSEARRGPIVHGDLYEAQIVVDADRIVGLLDIDDVGPGDPLDDRATVLGHLRYRAATTRTNAGRLSRYADSLRQGFIRSGVEPEALDLVTGAVMVGLATGPFRVQHTEWRDAVATHLATAQELVFGATDGAGR